MNLLLSKMQVIFDSLKHFQHSNPIEKISSRVKAPENIEKKLLNLGYEASPENARKYLTDIAGIRIICSYAKDIYHLADLIRSIPDIQVTIEKDYISSPKPSGYRSYHMIIEIPVYYSSKTEVVPVEVQLRTAAMDFWASLEHRVRYKYQEHIPKHLSDELVICADKIADLDKRMFLIHDIISLINQDT
ncbi:MAG: GTP pyrophosphokinase family protein [Treponema sp.]|nr:GTP pyrophosphokinase family protein [Treponema sp.]